MKAVAYAPEAERDLQEIWHYSAERWSPARADDYLTLVLDTVDSLAAGGLHGQRSSDVRAGYYRLLVGAHVVYYREAATELQVIRILHQSMDADRHLEQ